MWFLVVAAAGVAACSSTGDGQIRPSPTSASEASSTVRAPVSTPTTSVVPVATLPGTDVPVDCGRAKPDVVALQQATGAIVWEACSNVRQELKVIAATEQFVYAGTIHEAASTGSIVAFHAATGREQWVVDVPVMNENYQDLNYWADGEFAGAGVVVLSIDSWTIGFDAATGDELWRTETPNELVAAHTAEMALTAELGYQSFGPGPSLVHRYINARDRRSGEILWQLDLPRSVSISLAGDLILISEAGDGRDDVTIAVSASNGEEQWRLHGEAIDASAFGDGVLFGTAPEMEVNPRLIAIDPTDGRTLWSTVVHRVAAFNPPAPVVDSRNAYGRQGDKLVAFDNHSGALRWSRINSTVLTAMDGTAIVAEGGRLIAIDATSGGEVWATANPDGRDVAIINDALVFVS